MTFSYWFSCLQFPSVGITGVYYYTQFYAALGDQPQGLDHAREALYQLNYTSAPEGTSERKL